MTKRTFDLYVASALAGVLSNPEADPSGGGATEANPLGLLGTFVVEAALNTASAVCIRIGHDYMIDGRCDRCCARDPEHPERA